MMRPFDELRSAIETAWKVERACNDNANAMADLLLTGGSLKRLSHWRLERLKKALREYNMHTGTWSK